MLTCFEETLKKIHIFYHFLTRSWNPFSRKAPYQHRRLIGFVWCNKFVWWNKFTSKFGKVCISLDDCGTSFQRPDDLPNNTDHCMNMKIRHPMKFHTLDCLGQINETEISTSENTIWTSDFVKKTVPLMVQCKPDISRLVGSKQWYRDISGSVIYRATVMSQNQAPFSGALWAIMVLMRV